MHIKETLKTIRGLNQYLAGGAYACLRAHTLDLAAHRLRGETKIFVRLGNAPTGISATIFKSLRIPEQEEQGRSAIDTRNIDKLAVGCERHPRTAPVGAYPTG